MFFFKSYKYPLKFISRRTSEAGEEVQIAGVVHNQEVRRDILRKMMTSAPSPSEAPEVEQLCRAKVMAMLRAEQTLKAVTWNRVKESTALDPDLVLLTSLVQQGLTEEGDELPQGQRKRSRSLYI